MARLRTVGVAILALLASADAVAQVRWATDVETARAEALRRHQPVLLDFWATWCGPCDEMDLEVFPQARVASAMKKVVPVRIDIEKRPDLARRYAVTGTPTFVVTDGYGNLLFRFTGFLTADTFVRFLQELPANLERINTFGAALARDKDDVRALTGLAGDLQLHGLFRASNEYYRRALQTPAGKQRTDTRAEILRGLARNHQSLNEPAEAEKALKQYRKEFAERRRP